MTMITIIGRGHSGTRSISHTLSASGVFMGSPLNESGDLLPPEAMYDACRIFARHVKWKGNLEWDWDEAFNMIIPQEFIDLINQYLVSVSESDAEHKGFKIPETTLIFPWFIRMFPDWKYIFWVRDPRDSIIGAHLTDHLTDFGIQYSQTEDIRLRRAISWVYQYKLVEATLKPANWYAVRFEDFILRQEETLMGLETYLNMKLARIPIRKDSVGRWQSDTGTNYFDFFEPAMKEFGYEFTPMVMNS
jgi:hypothetical protein